MLITLGRLVPHKGVDTMLEAVAALRAAAPDLLYVVAGSGPDLERLTAITKANGLADCVRFVGRVPEAELPLYLGAADVFAMPSRFNPKGMEGFGIVFVEASACGLPVVATETGGIPDAVRDGETGLLLRDPSDVGALVAALGRLLDQEPLRRRMGRAGRAFVEQERSWAASRAALTRALAGL